MEDLSEFKRFARHLAEKSAAIIRPYFRTGISIDNKPDDSPVTIADKIAEEVMRSEIMKEFPAHGIIGEEHGNYQDEAEYKWVLDPIDGTRSFINGALSFGTLIALLKNEQPILGVINHPILKEFLMGDNLFTTLNGKTVNVRECNKLSEVTLLTTDHLNIAKYKNGKAFEKLIAKIKLYRNWGDCYGYYLVATGFADVMIDPIMSAWDKMALIPIIKGAGGIITNYEGNDPITKNSIVASSPGIHNKIIEALNDREE
jgi:myo-inositol-1(or 4)-monophosphatase